MSAAGCCLLFAAKHPHGLDGQLHDDRLDPAGFSQQGTEKQGENDRWERFALCNHEHPDSKGDTAENRVDLFAKIRREHSPAERADEGPGNDAGTVDDGS
jgi:hypothetical protein